MKSVIFACLLTFFGASAMAQEIRPPANDQERILALEVGQRIHSSNVSELRSMIQGYQADMRWVGSVDGGLQQILEEMDDSECRRRQRCTQRQIDRIRRAIRSLPSDYMPRAELAGILDGIEAGIAANTELIRAVEARVDQNAASIEALQDEIEELRSEIARVESESRARDEDNAYETEQVEQESLYRDVALERRVHVLEQRADEDDEEPNNQFGIGGQAWITGSVDAILATFHSVMQVGRNGKWAWNFTVGLGPGFAEESNTWAFTAGFGLDWTFWRFDAGHLRWDLADAYVLGDIRDMTEWEVASTQVAGTTGLAFNLFERVDFHAGLVVSHTITGPEEAQGDIGFAGGLRGYFGNTDREPLPDTYESQFADEERTTIYTHRQ